MSDIEVRPGQIWADNDPRAAGRLLRVDEVTETHAKVCVVNERGEPSPSILRARRTTIRLDRMRPTHTGYRLVSEAPGVSS